MFLFMKNKLKRKFSFFLLITVVILALLYFFFDFDFTGNDIPTKNFGQKDISQGNTAGFSYEVGSGSISGLKMFFFRDFIIEDENSRYLNFDVSYKDKDGEVRTINNKINLTAIKHRRYNFIDIDDFRIDKPTEVSVSIFLDRPLAESTLFEVGFDDHDPDPLIDRSPKIIYYQNLAGLSDEIKANFLTDKKFFFVYLTLIFIILLVIIII